MSGPAAAAKARVDRLGDAVRRVAARATPRGVLLAAIRFYKRVLSPRKGYGCAYRVQTGRASCSTLGYRAVARYGVFRGLGVLGLRLDQCRLEHERASSRRPPVRRGQAGFIDCACDAGLCDGSMCDVCGGALDVLDIAACVGDSDCGGGCCFDWRDRGRGCGRSRRRDDVDNVRAARERGRRRGTPPGPSGARPPLDHNPNSNWP